MKVLAVVLTIVILVLKISHRIVLDVPLSKLSKMMEAKTLLLRKEKPTKIKLLNLVACSAMKKSKRSVKSMP